MRVLPFYKDTFFNRLILSYTILAVVLLGLAGGYLYTQANRMMVDEIARDSQNRLDTVKGYMESTLLRKYEDNLQSKAISTVFLQSNSYLNILLDNGWDGNLSRVTSFRKDLEMIRQVLEGASNVTVYFQKGGFAVDSDRFYMTSEHSADAQFIQGLPTVGLNRWLVRSLPDGTQAMTYVVKLPYGTIGSPKGYLYVDVDLAYLQQTVAKIVSSPNERLYIFDADGKRIMQTAAASEHETELLERAIGSGQTVTKASDDRGAIVLSYLDRSKSPDGLTYAMIRPMNSFVLASRQLKTKIFIGCSLVLLIGFAISYLISKRFYLPMNRLIQRVRALYHPGPSHEHANEYAIIGNALHFMGQKIESLEIQAQKKELIHLVLGASLGMEHVDGLPRDCRYLVAHLQLIEGEAEDVRTRFGDLGPMTPHEFVCLTPQEAAVIFFLELHSETGEAEVAANLESAKEELRNAFRFGAGIGTAVQTPEEIPLSYRVAQQAYRYRFLFGEEAIVRHSEVKTFAPNPQRFSLESFQNALRAGNVEAIRQFIEEFGATLSGKRLQLEAVELALLQLASALYETVIDLGLQQLVPPSDLFDEWKQETLEESIEAIRSLSERIGIQVRDSGKHAQAEVIYRLKTYIDEHLQDELSLNVLSEVASLAPAYISTLFGEIMKESFTEYVTRARLDRAASLLRENDRLSVTDIASLVGYRNVQYFHVKFKGRFGVTPIQYRQSHS